MSGVVSILQILSFYPMTVLLQDYSFLHKKKMKHLSHLTRISVMEMGFGPSGSFRFFNYFITIVMFEYATIFGINDFLKEGRFKVNIRY